MPVFTEQMVTAGLGGQGPGAVVGRGPLTMAMSLAADPAGTAGLGDGLAHQPAPGCPVGGQRWHVPQHAGALPEPLPEGGEAAPHQG